MENWHPESSCLKPPRGEIVIKPCSELSKASSKKISIGTAPFLARERIGKQRHPHFRLGPSYVGPRMLVRGGSPKPELYREALKIKPWDLHGTGPNPHITKGTRKFPSSSLTWV